MVTMRMNYINRHLRLDLILFSVEYCSLYTTVVLHCHEAHVITLVLLVSHANRVPRGLRE